MNDELWRVQLGTGEVRFMSLDGLDRAFDEGLIDGHTPVLPPGAGATWTTLGAAAGLEDEDEDEDTKSEVTPSLSPIAISSGARSAPLLFSDSRATTGDAALPGGELELPDEVDLKPRRRALTVAGIATLLLAAAALTLVMSKIAGSEPVDVKATNAVRAPPPPAELPPPPVERAEPTRDKLQLSDEQKKRLVEADKAREEKARVKAQEKAEKAQRAQPRSRPVKSPPGLLNGGDRFDPLNGQL